MSLPELAAQAIQQAADRKAERLRQLDPVLDADEYESLLAFDPTKKLIGVSPVDQRAFLKEHQESPGDQKVWEALALGLRRAPSGVEEIFVQAGDILAVAGR